MVTEITMHDMQQPGGLPEDDYMHIVMFYGKTCGPCKATMPHYESAAAKFIEKNAKIKFHRIHAWENQEQRKYCIEVWEAEGVPHFKSFSNGQLLLTKVGGGDLNTMNTFILDSVDEAFKRFGTRI